ncbi:MAG: hypothetical protein HY515_04295 [Candidatus Aenigmarchaeota archaeon]|nr:hypothetical protein [Candidatus Aenigmarchaeota archaeon]
MRLTTPLTALFAGIFLSAVALAHGVAETTTKQNTIEGVLGVPDPVKVVLAASAVIAFFVVLSLVFKKSLREKHKKIMFVLIAVSIAAATLYLVGVTLALNSISATGGPVHWHADIEVWACGERYHFAHSQGWDNKVGTPLMHLHNDDRLHIEGVVVRMQDVELGEFFRAVGGSFTPESITMPTTVGVKKWFNGDACNGKMAFLYMFVSNRLETKMSEHVISPYSSVPPGDRIKIVFSEKPMDKINPNIGVEP